MLTVDLTKLEGGASATVRAHVPVEDALWADTELALQEAVGVDLTVSATPAGEVVAQGSIRARLAKECRRCLEPIDYSMAQEVTLVYAPVDELGDEDDPEIRPLEPVGSTLDLAAAVREETILAEPLYLLCQAECKGLCPRCGANHNVEDCGCVLEEPDPRWDVLRSLSNG